jgi:hypothetical protein
LAPRASSDIDVLVPFDELDAARPLLIGPPRHDRDPTVDPLDPADASRTYDRYRNRWWFGAVVMAMATTFFFMRLLAFG